MAETGIGWSHYINTRFKTDGTWPNWWKSHKKIQHEQHLSLKKVSKFISMLIPYQKTGKIPKIYKNDETLPKKMEKIS